MSRTLFMAGPAILEGVVLDVAPTAALVLGLALPGAEGRVLIEALA
jgi:hypothetical protein